MDEEEIYKVASFLDLNPNHSFWMLTMETNVNHTETNPQVEFNEELVSHINAFLKERNIISIVTQLSGNIVMLIDYPSFEELYMKQSKFISQLQKHCTRRFKKTRFLFGVSTIGDTIDSVPGLYEETLAALKAKK